MNNHIRICPKCGNIRFNAMQRCYHDVIVDGKNNFIADRGISEADEPYSEIYTCCNCGAEFDSLDELADAEILAPIDAGERGMKFLPGDVVRIDASDTYAGHVAKIDQMLGPAGKFPGGYIVYFHEDNENDPVNDICVYTEDRLTSIYDKRKKDKKC